LLFLLLSGALRSIIGLCCLALLLLSTNNKNTNNAAQVLLVPPRAGLLLSRSILGDCCITKDIQSIEKTIIGQQMMSAYDVVRLLVIIAVSIRPAVIGTSQVILMLMSRLTVLHINASITN
jgi:hypothetical protein